MTQNVGQPPSAVGFLDSRGRLSHMNRIAQHILTRRLSCARYPAQVHGRGSASLPILRYKPTGLLKREVWERTWELQREEERDQTTKNTKHTKEDPAIETESNSSDAFRVFRVFRGSNSGDSNPGGSTSEARSIPVPPKYTSADFLKSDYWRLRGKLDVPKERWIRNGTPRSTKSSVRRRVNRSKRCWSMMPMNWG